MKANVKLIGVVAVGVIVAGIIINAGKDIQLIKNAQDGFGG